MQVLHGEWEDSVLALIEPCLQLGFDEYLKLIDEDELKAFKKGASLSLALGDDEFLRKLNLQWRGKDNATNVLSFPVAEGMAWDKKQPMPLGDIAISHNKIYDEARLENKKPQDHFCHLLLHGLLHLMGEDHEDDVDAEAMEAIEIAILAKLGIGNPYLSPI